MKYVDLNHLLSNDTETYPTDPDISIVPKKQIDKDKSLLHLLTMGTHTGTHLDVPAHIIPDGKTLNDFPLSSFSGLTVKIDENSFTDLDKIEEKIDGIIYDTGWYKNFNNPDIFYGTNRPVIPEKLIEKLIGLNINIFGCDLPSVDASGSKYKSVHYALLGMDIIIYESLANLDKLPMLTPFNFFGFPLPLDGLDGSPVRAVAII